jgi:hypothetical protein
MSPVCSRNDLLLRMYVWQRRLIRELGIAVPPEDELFSEDCPLEARVAFYGWVIRQAVE